ncbi:MAG TPA: cytochrome b/b6 domain-containing protein [Allosphingosinicella sp.]
MADRSGAANAAIRVWDLPVRLVHWLMVLLIPFSWWSAENDEMSLHRLSGYVLLGLLLFRLVWGFVGSEPARFSRFVRGPAAVRRYLRGDRAGLALGHNPLGGWSVVAMFAVLALQIVFGLFSVDEDGLESGPLSYLVSFETGRTMHELHHNNFWLLLGLILVHVAAILWYLLVRRDNLIAAMITGRTRGSAGDDSPAMAPSWRAPIVLLAAAAVAWFVARGLR